MGSLDLNFDFVPLERLIRQGLSGEAGRLCLGGLIV